VNDWSFGSIWAATRAAVLRNSEIIVPVAGAFLFLPQLALQLVTGDFEQDQWLVLPQALFIAPVVLGVAIVSLIGQLVLTHIIIRDGTGTERTLGGVISQCAGLALPALAANLIQGLGVFFGLLLLVLPGLFLLSRLILVVPVIISETRDPVEALKRSWQLTEGRAFRVLGMLLILLLGLLLLSAAISGLGAALGVVTTVAAGQPAEGWGIGKWLFEVLKAGVSAAISVYWVAFIATLYGVLRANP